MAPAARGNGIHKTSATFPCVRLASARDLT